MLQLSSRRYGNSWRRFLRLWPLPASALSWKGAQKPNPASSRSMRLMLPLLLSMLILMGCATSGSNCAWLGGELPFHSTQYLKDGVTKGSQTEIKMLKLNQRWEAACK
jgi:hypothetical protein